MSAAEDEQAFADYTTAMVSRCRSAVQNHAGRPSPAWSHGEQMIVALVLDDEAFLTDVGTTADAARQRLHGDLSWHQRRPWSADELNRWIADARAAALSGE